MNTPPPRPLKNQYGPRLRRLSYTLGYLSVGVGGVCSELREGNSAEEFGIDRVFA